MRFIPLFSALTALVCAVAFAGPAASQSQESLRKLSEIYKLIQDDQAREAVEQLNALLEETPGDSATAASALLLRGQAYAKAGRHAQALSDFNAALWLQGLNPSQRRDAVAGLQAALGELGLAEEDAAPAAVQDADPQRTASIPTSIPTSTDEDEEPAAAPAPAPETTPAAEAVSAPQTTRAPAAAAWQTEVETSDTEESDSIGSFFSSLFGGGSDEPDPAPQRETQTAASSGWTASTTDAATTSSGSGSERVYRVQIASVGTRDGAESEVRRLSRLLGDALEGETPSIQRTDTDQGNTYFRIVVGPKPSRDAASSMCDKFKSRGVDCLVVSSR